MPPRKRKLTTTKKEPVAKKAKEFSVYVGENGDPVKIHLCKTDIAQNSNKFYDLELQATSNRSDFRVQMINGRIGYKGVTHYKEFGVHGKALEFFESKFLAKSGNHWIGSKEVYDPVPGKYVTVELSEKVHKDEDEDEDDSESEPTADVDVPEADSAAVQLMSAICNDKQHANELLLMHFGCGDVHGKPLDNLTLEQINKGFDILTEIEEALTKKKSLLIQLSNEYYSLIPHSYKFHTPPPLKSLVVIHRETENLNSLKSAFETSLAVKGTKKKNTSNPYLELYHGLPCNVVLLTGGEKYETIVKCAMIRAPSHCYDVRIDAVYEVQPKAPAKIDTDAIPSSEKLLLWHGTRLTSVYSIMAKGLLLPEGPRGDLMFGKGIYFASVPSKALNYSLRLRTGKVYILLCEVHVGKQKKFNQSDLDAPKLMRKEKCDSVYAEARSLLDSTCKIGDVDIHCGELKDADESSELLYDEYVVYDPSQVAVRYVLQVEAQLMTM